MTERELTVARLAATPTLLREMARDGAGEAWTPPKPGEWSIGEVVRHLVEGDRDTFVPRLRRMLAESRPVFDKGRRTDGDRADLATLLDAFAAARRQAVALLGGLDDAGWRREGVSPSRGPLTVATYAATMDAHDTEHLRQIQDVRAIGARAASRTTSRPFAAPAPRRWPTSPRCRPAPASARASPATSARSPSRTTRRTWPTTTSSTSPRCAPAARSSPRVAVRAEPVPPAKRAVK